MEKRRAKRFALPPVVKLLLRGYIIMGFILAMAQLGMVSSIPLIIFMVTVISVSMVFGVGCLLVMGSRPVRASSADIPNTVLFFAKGIIVIYFISLLAEFSILPDRITSFLMLATAGIVALAGCGSYIVEVLDRSRPVPRPVHRARPRTR